MRIIAGQWRGRPIAAPAGTATRPTSDRTREGLFSMLVSRLGSFDELKVADLFAGTGALGLEALSRGAGSCAFFETDRKALEILTANAKKLGAGDRADIHARSALHISGGRYDLVLIDPPYGSGLGQQALAALTEGGAVAPGGWVSVETARDEAIEAPAGFQLEVERNYGKARLSLLRRSA